MDKSRIRLDDPIVIARKSYIWDPAVAYGSIENRYLAVYHREGNMYARRLGSSGKGVGKEIQLICDRVSPNNAEVLFDAVHNCFLAFWSVGATRVVARIVSAN